MLVFSPSPKDVCCCSVAQLCPTPSDPMDCSLPGSSVRGIFQARVLEWGAIAFSKGSLEEGANGLIRTGWTEPEEGTNRAELGLEEGPAGSGPGWEGAGLRPREGGARRPPGSDRRPRPQCLWVPARGTGPQPPCVIYSPNFPDEQLLSHVQLFATL